MPINHEPDYEMAAEVVASSPSQLKALADPLRSTLLDLVLERAATVAELAAATGRAKSTVAHHVNVLVDAGLLHVVRRRRVRAIEERSYGRAGRTIAVAPSESAHGVEPISFFSEAASDTASAGERDELRSTIRRARIPAERAAEFWSRVLELADEFAALERSGDVVHGFVAAVYPTDQPTLPPKREDEP